MARFVHSTSHTASRKQGLGSTLSSFSHFTQSLVCHLLVDRIKDGSGAEAFYGIDGDSRIGTCHRIVKSLAAGASTASGTMAESGAFRYPPIHAFPPFYTIQHNPVSRAQQLSQWRALILDYCRHHCIFALSPLPGTSDLGTRSEAADPHQSLFANRSIQRSLSSEAVRQVLTDLVDHKQAAWEDQLTGTKSKSSNANAKAFIYWKTPVQWADAIYDWVMQTGQNKIIMTLFELNQGELVQSQDFYELPMPMLRQALKHLSTQGKAQIFAGTEADDGEGVKFV